MTHYFETECAQLSEEFEALVSEMLQAEIPWEGPAKKVKGYHPDATYWERRVGGDNPGLGTVSTFPGKFVWAWRPDRGAGGDSDSTFHSTPGTAADGWAQVDLAIRRQMVRR